MGYLPGLLSDGVLAPGLTPAAVRSTLDVPSNQDLTDAIDTVDLSGYLPLSGGTLTGNLAGVGASFSSLTMPAGQTWSSSFGGNALGNIWTDGNVLRLGAGGYVGWTASGNPSNPSNLSVGLYFGGSGTVAQRNGLNPQAFYVYNTYTSGTDYERGGMWWDGDEFLIGTGKDGSGVTRRIRFKAPTGLNVDVNIDGIRFSDGNSISGVARLIFEGTNARFISTGGKLFLDNAVNGTPFPLTLGTITLLGLATSDPGVANEVWNDSGTLKISAG